MNVTTIIAIIIICVYIETRLQINEVVGVLIIGFIDIYQN